MRAAAFASLQFPSSHTFSCFHSPLPAGPEKKRKAVKRCIGRVSGMWVAERQQVRATAFFQQHRVTPLKNGSRLSNEQTHHEQRARTKKRKNTRVNCTATGKLNTERNRGTREENWGSMKTTKLEGATEQRYLREEHTILILFLKSEQEGGEQGDGEGKRAESEKRKQQAGSGHEKNGPISFVLFMCVLPYSTVVDTRVWMRQVEDESNV